MLTCPWQLHAEIEPQLLAGGFASLTMPKPSRPRGGVTISVCPMSEKNRVEQFWPFTTRALSNDCSARQRRRRRL